jgi:hypothetical protein
VQNLAREMAVSVAVTPLNEQRCSAVDRSVRIALALTLPTTCACGAPPLQLQTPPPSIVSSQALATPPAESPAPKIAASPSFAPCPPVVTATPGINSGAVQVGPDSWETFVTSNQWIGPKNGSATTWYHVYAGRTGEAATPPDVASIWVDMTTLSSDQCSINPLTVGDFTDPGAQGALSITSVQDLWVYLRAADGQRIYFNLGTDRFSTSAPAPAPA